MRLLLFSLALILLGAIVFADSLTFQSSAATAWWNDTVVINGTATYTNGSNVQNANVNITVGNVNCINTTDANGRYTCEFSAPKELGTYTVKINITNSTGPSISEQTTLAVKLKYGNTPIGTIDRVVYETPVFIQEMSGKINVVFVRITAWRV